MSVLQITDVHIQPAGTLAFGHCDTAKRALEVVEWIERNQKRFEAVVVTGDIACDGNSDSYALAASLFSSLALPVFMIPGNHDRRAEFWHYLADFAPNVRDPQSDLSFCVDLPGKRLICLDTLQPGIHWGKVKDDTLNWLEEEIAQSPYPVLVFTHHSPAKPLQHFMDEPFGNKERFLSILHSREDVRLCTGHLHRAMTALVNGVVVAVCPSVTLMMNLELGRNAGNDFVDEAAAYALHEWSAEDGWITHYGQMPIPFVFSGPREFTNSVNPS